MPAHVKAAEKVAPPEEARPLTTVLADGENDPGKVIAFSELARGFTEVSEGEGAVVPFGDDKRGVRATGLHTCAAICFVNTRGSGEPVGYVYHANAGSISYSTFIEIIKAIGARAGSDYLGVYVAYAHRYDTDGPHDRSVADLRKWLDKGKLVQITNVFLNQFGMNGHFQIGY